MAALPLRAVSEVDGHAKPVLEMGQFPRAGGRQSLAERVTLDGFAEAVSEGGARCDEKINTNGDANRWSGVRESGKDLGRTPGDGGTSLGGGFDARESGAGLEVRADAAAAGAEIEQTLTDQGMHIGAVVLRVYIGRSGGLAGCEQG